MKKWVSGLIVGAMLASSTVVGAASENITALHTPQVKFKFNGEDKQVSDGYTVLMYQDRTYVPARFVAENMGGTVEWDGANQTVVVKTNNVKNISTYTKNVMAALKSQNVPVESAFFSVDEKGGYMSFNYNDKGVDFDELGLYITQMAAGSIMYSEPLDGVMVNVYDSQGTNRILSYWVPSEKTLQFSSGKLTKSDYINSWVVKTFR